MNVEPERAKQNPEARERFIRENEDFILRCAGKASRRCITKSDDEWAAALSAFNEAIDAYDSSKGNFYAFAALLIQRRTADAWRREKRREIAVEPAAFDGRLSETPSPLEAEVALRSAAVSQKPITIQEEIEMMQKTLHLYGFSFFDLKDCSPHWPRTRKECAQAVSVLLDHEELVETMRHTRSLPAKAIRQEAQIPAKVLERHRKWIIAVVEILKGPYPDLQGYVSDFRKEVKT
jgi:RNA polymerase sigma factor